MHTSSVENDHVKDTVNLMIAIRLVCRSSREGVSAGTAQAQRRHSAGTAQAQHGQQHRHSTGSSTGTAQASTQAAARASRPLHLQRNDELVLHPHWGATVLACHRQCPLHRRHIVRGP